MTRYLPSPWPAAYDREAVSRGKCNTKSFLLAVAHPDELVLVAGYARPSEGSPWLGHWWCADESGRVVDPSWDPEGIAYVGEEVDPGEVDLGEPFTARLHIVAPDDLAAGLARIWGAA